MSPKRNWRETAVPYFEAVAHGIWYRSPLWEKDHALGRIKEFTAEGVAWCGRPLTAAQEGWGDPDLEGLWLTNRRSAKCSECSRREQEWADTYGSQ